MSWIKFWWGFLLYAWCQTAHRKYRERLHVFPTREELLFGGKFKVRSHWELHKCSKCNEIRLTSVIHEHASKFV